MLKNNNCPYLGQPRLAGTRTLGNFNPICHHSRPEILTSTPIFPSWPPILPLGSNTNENPGKTAERIVKTRGEESTLPLYFLFLDLMPPLVNYYTRLSLYDY